MRILLAGNAPWSPSGYGEQIALLVPRLQALGHEVACAANYGVQETIAPWGNISVFPCSGDFDAKIGYYAEAFEADIVLALMDSWTMKPDKWPDDLEMAVWAPVDHYPLPPLVYAVLQHEKVRPVAMSRFGEHWMRNQKLDPLYAPHGVDTSLFKPYPELGDAIRDEMGIPRDAFLAGMVAANKGWNASAPRKSFPQVIEAFSRFSQEHDDAWLYLHTNPTPGHPGIDLMSLINMTDLLAPNRGHLKARVRAPHPKEVTMGTPREMLAAQYSAFDVLLNPSMSEGFGVPILEAQACGVPVITADHSAMPEITQAGWIATGDPWWDDLQSSFAYMPHVASIQHALEAAYAARDDQELRARAVEFAAGYDADLVVREYWEPIVDGLAKPREVPPLVVTNGNRAMRRAAKKAKAGV